MTDCRLSPSLSGGGWGQKTSRVGVTVHQHEFHIIPQFQDVAPNEILIEICKKDKTIVSEIWKNYKAVNEHNTTTKFHRAQKKASSNNTKMPNTRHYLNVTSARTIPIKP